MYFKLSAVIECLLCIKVLISIYPVLAVALALKFVLLNYLQITVLDPDVKKQKFIE